MWNAGGDEPRKHTDWSDAQLSGQFVLAYQNPKSATARLIMGPHTPTFYERKILKSLQCKYYTFLAKFMLCTHHTLSFLILEKRFTRHAQRPLALACIRVAKRPSIN